MFYPPPFLQFIHVSNVLPFAEVFTNGNLLSMISTEFLYILSALLPMLTMPIVLPMVVLMARRKRLTDNPNARKMQDRPVAVMGGTVIMLVLCITSIVLNLFYDLSSLFPAMCVMVILYIFGMLDDNIGLSWKFKLVMQIFAILLLFFGGYNGVDSMYGLFGLNDMPLWASFLLTVYAGLLLFNAVNFVDGIDGLASGLGVLAGAVMGYWNVCHGFTTQAILSFIVVGVMVSFFFFNVFSERYKMYMGDSGSLVLGLFIFILACPDTYYAVENEFLVDRYFVSFLVALLSAMIFDLFRVVIMRMLKGKSPFEPDRTHLHHAYVDLGMSHLLATLKIMMQNMAVVAVWFLTAMTEMNVAMQFIVVLVAGIVFLWMPYFFLEYLKNNHISFYIKISKRCKRHSDRLEVVGGWIRRIIDGRRKQLISHSIK